MGKTKYPEDRPCTKCGKSFPEVKFYYRGSQRKSQCASCEGEYKKQWNQANLGRRRSAYKRYRRAHPDRKQKRRDLLKNLPEHFTTQEWQELKNYYNHRCLCCGKSANDDGVVITPDHVIPLSKGGTNVISNIQPLCFSCNSRKGTRDTDYRYYHSA